MTTVREKIGKLKEMGFSEGEIIRILELEEFPTKMENNNQTKKPDVTKVLKELGVPASILGYGYLIEAVKMASETESILPITKQIYPEVAKKKESTSGRVERAIRHAIETAWNRGNIDFMAELFGYTVDAKRGKPTNSEFIAAVAEYIRNS